MTKILNKYPFLITLFFILIIGLPSLFVGWAMVDDGKSAQVAFALSNSFRSFDIKHFFANFLESDSGRFRPIYWLYMWSTFLVGGSSALLHHLIQFVAFGLSAYLIYYLTAYMFKNRWSGVLASALFVINPIILENWYRLGPQEPIQLIFLLIYLLFYIFYRQGGKRSKFLIALLSLIISVLYKETSIAIVGVAAFLVVYDFISKETKEKLNKDLINFVIVFVINLGVRLFALKLYAASGYASMYELNSSIFLNLKSYVDIIIINYRPILEIACLSFIVRFFISLKRTNLSSTLKVFFGQFFWLSWFVCFLVIQLPWGVTFGRYLLIVLVGLIIFISTEFVNTISFLTNFIKNVKNNGRSDVLGIASISQLLLILILIVIGIYQIAMSYSYIAWVLPVTNYGTSFVAGIVQNAPKGSNVYFDYDQTNSPPLELFMETGWHLTYFYERGDINVLYLNKNYKPKNNDLIVFQTASPYISQKDLKTKYHANLILNNSTSFSTFNLKSPMELLKDLPSLLISFFRGNDYLDQNLLTLSDYSYTWKIYKVNIK